MDIPIEDLVHRKTLVIGGIKSGKTLFTGAFVKEILRTREERVAVLDFAPDIFHGVGGKMVVLDHPRLRYLTAAITAPRLKGKNKAEMLELAEGNRRHIEALLESYRVAPEPVLVINDVTLYLHAGFAERLAAVAGAASTLLVNAYCGDDFEEVFLSRRERLELERFAPFFDRVLRMAAGRVVEEGADVA